MSTLVTTHSLVLMVLAYKVASMLVGLGFAYMGYRLFVAGVYEKAGELKAAWGGRSLALRQAAPGTFFAVLGALTVAAAVLKGLSVEGPPRTSGVAAAEGNPALLGSISALADPTAMTGANSAGLAEQIERKLSAQQAAIEKLQANQAAIVELLASMGKPASTNTLR